MDLRGMCRWLKKWKAADRVKGWIEALGAVVFDGPGGKSWWLRKHRWEEAQREQAAQKMADAWQKSQEVSAEQQRRRGTTFWKADGHEYLLKDGRESKTGRFDQRLIDYHARFHTPKEQWKPIQWWAFD